MALLRGKHFFLEISLIRYLKTENFVPISKTHFGDKMPPKNVKIIKRKKSN
jgi:hypothetical protein